ncbi:MAG: PL29 family lyase N-terminal domain-containing protein [Duncaniella sp.]|nr:PL29 family lyase N-terminal domain-containing protein [Duncaniella sp.]
MNKKFINGLLLATLMVGTAGCFTSCKDYDDDINDLQGQINNIKASVDELKAIVAKGGVITGVTSTSDGFVFTMSDGKTVTVYNGKDGAQGPQGEPGKNGTVWTIGPDGYWYCDGVKTDNLAVPKSGAAGEAGKPGENGKYYVPNEETGKFDIYQDGKLIEATDISWVAAGPTASFDGTTLILSNLKDADGKTLDPVKIQVGITLTSIAVVADDFNSGFPLVTFTTLQNKSIDKANTIPGKDWAKSKNALNVSNEVVINYRKNPADAFVAPSASVSYIDRDANIAASRATGDSNKLLSGSIVESTSDDVVSVSTSINLSAYNDIINDKDKDGRKDPIAALQLTNGQNMFTSDFLLVNQKNVTAVLVDKAKTTKNKVAYTADIAEITKAPAASNQTVTQYINQFVTGNTETAIELGLQQPVDLANFAGLYTGNASTQGSFLEDLGYNNVSYVYSLPASYVIGQTDQQVFVTLNGTVLSVNPAYTTSPEGRTPIVQVDAYVGNALVATAFIKVQIVKATGSKDDVNVTIPTSGSADLTYSTIAKPNSVGNSKTNQKVAELGWQAINTQIYDAVGLNSVEFNTKYTGPTVKVTIPVTWNNGSKKGNAVYEFSGPATVAGGSNASVYYNNDVPGLYVSCNLSADATTTNAPIQVWVNNLIHTQDGQLKNAKGADKQALNSGNPVQIAGPAATYNIDITYNSSTPATLGNVVISKTVTVTETHEAPIYSNFVSNNAVTTFGALYPATNGNYSMLFQLTNAFMRGDNNTDIFTYLDGTNTLNNVKAITFTGIDIPQQKISGKMTDLLAPCDASGNVVSIPGFTDPYNPTAAEISAYYAALARIRMIKLTAAGLDYEPATATIEFELTLANGEICPKAYELAITFNNPFVGTTGTAITLNGNAPLAAPLNVKPSLVVNDHNGSTILSWGVKTPAVTDANGNVTTAAVYDLILSDIATAATGYKVTNYTVSYDFDKASKEYIKGMAAGKLEINSATGEVTYVPGAVLVEGKTLTIEATARFNSGTSNTFSKVVCKIPLNITTGNN